MRGAIILGLMVVLSACEERPIDLTPELTSEQLTDVVIVLRTSMNQLERRIDELEVENSQLVATLQSTN